MATATLLTSEQAWKRIDARVREHRTRLAAQLAHNPATWSEAEWKEHDRLIRETLLAADELARAIYIEWPLIAPESMAFGQ